MKRALFLLRINLSQNNNNSKFLIKEVRKLFFFNFGIKMTTTAERLNQRHRAPLASNSICSPFGFANLSLLLKAFSWRRSLTLNAVLTAILYVFGWLCILFRATIDNGHGPDFDVWIF